MERVVYLTTVDNPYDPYSQWREWYYYDMVAGYSSCCYLDRVCHTSDQLSEEENLEEIERAIDEIVAFNPLVYRKLVKMIPVQ